LQALGYFSNLLLHACEIISSEKARYMLSTLEIHFLFFMNEFREGTYTPLRGVRHYGSVKPGMITFALPQICFLCLLRGYMVPF
jgi:hypothetical protein